MMFLKAACQPRASVFNRDRRDVVLDLSDLLEGKISGEQFFEENYVTAGMRTLLEKTFLRLGGASDQTSTFLLTQAMGGGKTHNMIALGLLAKDPALREQVLGHHSPGNKLGAVRVIGFHGRQTDAKFGIWGALAEQLGKKDLFRDYYQPLQAPGQNAWISLLQGEPTIILLDELPPYMAAVQAKEIGTTTLATVTASALSNLLVAANKAELSNVVVVISDLTASWADGGALVNSALQNLTNETNRSALRIEPVAAQGDEVYHILRTRLFKSLPDEDAQKKIANDYATAVKAAKEMDVTNASPDSFAAQLIDSYPFHFSLRDLYARFKENPGFQQTRGLIRLMRMVVSNLWETDRAQQIRLIHPYDLDLNDPEIRNEVRSIKPTLDEAINHDIAKSGHAVAEEIDARYNSTDAQDVSKLLLVASLASVPGAQHGLRPSDIVAFLCSPGRDIAKVKKEIIDYIPTQAWYLHTSADGRLFFKNIQNLAAKLHTTAQAYTEQTRLKELKSYLSGLFPVKLGDVYQRIDVLPAIDEVQLESDRTVLVLVTPSTVTDPQCKLPLEWKDFFDSQTFKNRVLFLTGARQTLVQVLENAAQFKAIQAIQEELIAEGLPASDAQRRQSDNVLSQIQLRLRSAIQETFTTLVYPNMGQLRVSDFRIQFDNNQFDGEKLVRETLTATKKFETDVSSDVFRKKAEQRLFAGQKIARWTEVKRRAATSDNWPMHHPNALDKLRDKSVNEGHWKDLGDSVEIGPFPPPKTEVQVRQISRDEDGTCYLKIVPIHGEVVYYEVGDNNPTIASAKVSDAEGGFNNFKTRELKLRFLCVDATGKHETGNVAEWQNVISLRHRLYQDGSDWRCELRAYPRGKIKYTTNGADPQNNGGIYDAPFLVPSDSRFVLGVAESEGIYSPVERIDVQQYKTREVQIDPTLPVRWKRPHKNLTAATAFDFMKRLKQFNGRAFEVTIDVVANDETQELNYIASPELPINGEQFEAKVAHMQAMLDGSQVTLSSAWIEFSKGQDLLDWIRDIHGKLEPEQVVQ